MCIPVLVHDHLTVFVGISILLGFIASIVVTFVWGLPGLLGLALTIVFLMILVAVNPSMVHYCGTGV